MRPIRLLILLAAFVAVAGIAVAENADEHLPRPFTADQIRNEWQPGLSLVMRQTAGDSISLQRWTVRSADKEGVDIEYASIDESGAVTAESTITRSTWLELRDHATFSATSAQRSTATAKTAFGPLEGWLYTVTDDTAGTATIFFFAESLPGAPVDMIVTSNGQQTMRVEMVERSSVSGGTD